MTSQFKALNENFNDVLERARFAEMIGRFEDMAKMMRKFVESSDSKQLDREQRNMLSLAYKSVAGQKRSLWRNLQQLMVKEDMSTLQRAICADYCKTVMEELLQICSEIVALLDDYLIENAGDPECKVFYLKMKGDYCRYMAEIVTESREDATNRSLNAYEEACAIADRQLEVTNPVRLGLLLNFSVFHFEILNSMENARKLGKKAFEEALSRVDTIENEDERRDVSLILELLQDNLSLWSVVDSIDQQGEIVAEARQNGHEEFEEDVFGELDEDRNQTYS